MLAIMLTSLLSSADTGSSQKPNPSSNGSAVLDLVSGYPDIKRMPSRNHLNVIYEDGILTLISEKKCIA